MDELQEILSRLEKITPEEQAQVAQWITKQEQARIDQRRKELWENVVAAIKQYEIEMGDDILFCDNNELDKVWKIDELSMNALGTIFIENF